jgi:Uma2 family endonuclease
MAIQAAASTRDLREPDGGDAVPMVPPLENGDRLTRAELERRYEAMPHLKTAELIEGVVYLGSPVRYRQHGKPEADAQIWLGTYRIATPGTGSGGNSTVRLDLDNEPQPDVLLRRETGGSSRESEDGYLEGAPDLVVEIAASSASYDLHDKLHAYRRNGVREYVIWRVQDRQLDWLVLREGRYQPLAPDAQGVIRSEAFPGLWLAAEALLRSDMAAVMATLQQGLASPEHAAFVARLQGASAPTAPAPSSESAG